MTDGMQGVRDRNRANWAVGDWDSVADLVAAAGPRLLDRVASVGPATRLLDIGTGSGGNVAIPAAQRGASVVGLDCTDEWFEAARRRAGDVGVEVEWVVGEAAALPFGDDTFDVVASTFGHMFEPDHAAAARELVRVCKPGGKIGYTAWTPQGKVAGLFRVLASRLPAPPAGALPPPLWGDEAHARELLEPLGVTVDARVQSVVFRFDSPQAQYEFMGTNFGPLVAARAALGEDAWAEIEPELVAYYEADNEATDGTMVSTGDYLEVVGHLRT